MMIGCFNIFLKSIIWMTLVQSYQTSPHRTVVIQALVSINHMPSKTGNRSPSSFTESLIIQTMKIRLISFVKNKLHILQHIILIFPVLYFITQLHQSHICYSVCVMPIQIFTIDTYIRI